MADIGVPEQVIPDTIEKKLKSASALLSPNDNPLLKTREKLFIHALVRGTSFTPSNVPETVKAKGISAESLETLKTMVTFHNGERKPYHIMINEFNSKNDYDSPVLLTNPRTAGVLTTVASGISGNLEGVIDRVYNGEGNCLEFSLVMQLVGKLFYEDEVKEAQILAYSENTNLLGENARETRHFYLFTREKDMAGESISPYLTPYAGKRRNLTREQATTWLETSKKERSVGLRNIYNGYIRLLDRNQ